MEMDIMDKVERFKIKANIFLKDKIPAFIENINGDYFFCDILKIFENYIEVYNFDGRRKGEIDRIFFIDILIFTDYKEQDGGEK